MSRDRELALRIEGTVQGVGFRYFVREQARALGVAGWVWNAPDGAVELAAAGDPAQLARLRATVERGPPGARVRRVTELDAARRGITNAIEHRPYTILRGSDRPGRRAADADSLTDRGEQ